MYQLYLEDFELRDEDICEQLEEAIEDPWIRDRVRETEISDTLVETGEDATSRQHETDSSDFRQLFVDIALSMFHLDYSQRKRRIIENKHDGERLAYIADLDTNHKKRIEDITACFKDQNGGRGKPDWRAIMHQVTIENPEIDQLSQL